MQIINLFPLSIVKEKISLDQNIKNQMIEEIRIMVKNSKNEKYKRGISSWTGDTQGFEYICRNEKFKKLFIEIKKKILNYLNHLKIDEKAIELYITRSWATVSNGKENILNDEIRLNRRKIGFNSNLRSITNFNQNTLFEFLNQNKDLKDLIKLEEIKKIDFEKELSNTTSKFLFSVICLKIFLDKN